LIKKHSDAEVMIQQGCLLHKNREAVSLHAIKNKYDYLFFVDSDMCFASGVLQRLIDDDKEIVGGNYFCRHLPPVSTVKLEDDNGNLIASDNELPKGLIKVHALGTGCLLIKVSILEKIPKPWFWYGDPDKPEEQCGEDLWFCRQAKKAGYEIWCDNTIQIGHCGEYVY
jgi:hypothetical protein